MTDTTQPLSVVALVSVNDREALVLNRPLKFVYEFNGKDLIGSDGSFRDFMYHEAPTKYSQAFAGRKFDLPLKDGGEVHCSGQYWSGHISGMETVSHASVEQLKNCYVFYSGACCEPDALAELKSKYEGVVYPYWDYEKVVCYDDMRIKYIRKNLKLERDKEHLIKQVKEAHAALKTV